MTPPNPLRLRRTWVLSRQVVEASHGVERPRPAITSPPSLAGTHAGLIRTYVAVRAGCAQVRLTALAARTALDRAFTTQSAADRQASDHATAVAHRDLQRFKHGALRSFPKAVNRWRLAVVAYEATLGKAPPAWLTQLSP